MFFLKEHANELRQMTLCLCFAAVAKSSSRQDKDFGYNQCKLSASDIRPPLNKPPCCTIKISKRNLHKNLLDQVDLLAGETWLQLKITERFFFEKDVWKTTKNC